MKETKEIVIPSGFKFKEEKPGVIVVEKTTSPEDKFKELIEGLTIKFDEKYPDSTFFMKDGNVIFQLFKSNFWVDYSAFWAIFEKEFSMEHVDIETFITTMMEKHLKMKGVTPRKRWPHLQKQVEKHLKMKGVTPIVI